MSCSDTQNIQPRRDMGIPILLPKIIILNKEHRCVKMEGVEQHESQPSRTWQKTSRQNVMSLSN